MTLDSVADGSLGVVHMDSLLLAKILLLANVYDWDGMEAEAAHNDVQGCCGGVLGRMGR